MKKLILLLTLLLISGAAFAGIFGGRAGVQSTSTPASIIAVAVTPNSFLAGSGDGTSVGAVSVTATGATFNGTLAIGPGGQGGAFRLSSTTLPANLLISGTQPAGTYTINLVPTQAGLTNSGNAFPVTITGTAVTAGCSQGAAFLANVPGIGAGYQDAYKAYICGLVADGVIPVTASMTSSGSTPYCGNKLDALWVMATSDATTANKDLCGHTAYTLVPNGSPNFTANQGYLGVGGSSTVYLNTGYNPATASGNLTQNSAHMAVWSMTNAQSAGGNAGTAMGSFNGSTNISQILPWYNDGNGYGAVNASPSNGQIGVSVSDSSGYYVVSRTASNAETLYKNGTSIGTNTSASQSLLSLPIYILGRNTNGSAEAGAGLRIAMANVGAGLSAGDVTALRARGCAYLTALNGTCTTPQAFASIRPSSCSFASDRRNGPVCALTVTMNPPSPVSTAALTLTGSNSGHFHLIGSGCSNISVGSTSTPPSGPALVTGDGTWTWGAAAAGRPSEYNISLNGGASVGIGLYMQVTGGQLYANTASFGWFVWNGSAFVSASAPAAADGCLLEQSSASAGTAAGTYTDVSVVATQAGISNSPMAQLLTLTGTAGGSGSDGPTPPTQATIAGFDTCIMCIDFTAPTGGVIVNGSVVAGVDASNPATWLDCAGSSNPLWFHKSNGLDTESLPCPDVVNDGLGNPRVLRNTNGVLFNPNVNGMKMYDNGRGIMVPTNLYMETTFLVPQFPLHGYIEDIWTGGAGEIPANVHNYLEFDSFEVNTNNAPGAMASCMGSWSTGLVPLGCNWFGENPPNYGSTDFTARYMKIGTRVTSDGNTVYKCQWIDDVFQNCIHAGPPDNSSWFSWQLNDDSRSRMQAYLIFTGCIGPFCRPDQPTSGPMTAYAKSANIWSCTSWQTTACRSGSADPGGF